jgi:adenine-specific DNA glycosylase
MASPQPFEPPFPGRWRALHRPVTHGFTHFTLTLETHRLEWLGDEPPLDHAVVWHRLEDLADAGLPTLFRKVADAVLASAIPAGIGGGC